MLNFNRYWLDRHIKQMLQLHFLLSTNNDFSLDSDRDDDIMLGPADVSVVPHETNLNLLRKMMQKDFGGLDGFKRTTPNMLTPLTLIAYLEYSVEVEEEGKVVKKYLSNETSRESSDHNVQYIRKTGPRAYVKRIKCVTCQW
ncbi:hypothetical protein TKK_0000838 [Trichogramma kaykai]